MIESIQTPESPFTKGLVAITGFFAALALFVAIPMIQAISTGLKDPNKLNELQFMLPPPPVTEFEAPPPPQKEEEKEEMEMAKEPPKLSLDQLEMALNPSTGDFMSGISLDLSLDSSSLGTDDLIFDIGDVEEKPTVTRRIDPIYPPALKRQKVRGSAVVIFVVDENGNVVAPRIDSATHKEFEKSALDAIRRWKFSPGKNDGRAVKTRVKAPFNFNIK